MPLNHFMSIDVEIIFDGRYVGGRTCCNLQKALVYQRVRNILKCLQRTNVFRVIKYLKHLKYVDTSWSKEDLKCLKYANTSESLKDLKCLKYVDISRSREDLKCLKYANILGVEEDYNVGESSIHDEDGCIIYQIMVLFPPRILLAPFSHLIIFFCLYRYTYTTLWTNFPYSFFIFFLYLNSEIKTPFLLY